MLSLQLDSDKTYTAHEVIQIVLESLEFAVTQTGQRDFQYSSSDVYWVLKNLLDYMNKRITGEFTLKRLKNGALGLEYLREERAKRRSDEQNKQALRRTADLIQEMTNKRPPWG